MVKSRKQQISKNLLRLKKNKKVNRNTRKLIKFIGGGSAAPSN